MARAPASGKPTIKRGPQKPSNIVRDALGTPMRVGQGASLAKLGKKP